MKCYQPAALTLYVIVITFVCGGKSSASLMVIDDAIPAGTESVDTGVAFIGILTNVLPTEIGGTAVRFNRVPPGEDFEVDDLVGRRIAASGGGRAWEYQLSLPADAVAGTGFTDIDFLGSAFEREGNNLEGTDQLTWELFLNGSSTPVDITGPAAGTDWSTFTVNLTDMGGSTVNLVQVVFTVTGFNAGNEWFATRGQLSATYETLSPEPSTMNLSNLVLSMASLLTVRRRRRAI